MNQYVYEAQNGMYRQDHPTAEAAIQDIEARGSGAIVKFIVEPNLPNCLPHYVHKSLAMWIYNNEDRNGSPIPPKWRVYYIHGAGQLGPEERPH